MIRRTLRRKTHRRKTHRPRHGRMRITRKRGGSGCGSCAAGLMRGGRGYTTGASQALYQEIGSTPGLSSGGRRRNRSRRNRN
jgi:hypothetical protein